MIAVLHLSFPVRDLAEALRFYVEVVGCEPGRQSQAWADVWFFGMQVTLQERPDEVVPPDEVGTRHFGVSLDAGSMDALLNRLEQHGVEWLVPSSVDFAGTDLEQRKAKFRDPSGNVIEVKTYRIPEVALRVPG